MTRPEASDPLSTLRERVSDQTIRDVNRVLLEGLFFYKRDQPILYSKLEEHRDAFIAFWEQVIGLRLVVTPQLAYRRLPSDDNDPSVGFLNPSIRPDQRDLLGWSGAHMSVRTTVFLMFLKYAEEDLVKRNPDRNGDREFRYDEFYRYTQDQFRMASAAGGWPNPVAGDDSRLLQDSITKVFEKLERFRFIELDRQEIVTTQADLDRLPPGMDRVKFYRALPGVYTYDSRALNQSLLDKSFAGARAPAEASPDAQPPEETP